MAAILKTNDQLITKSLEDGRGAILKIVTQKKIDKNNNLTWYFYVSTPSILIRDNSLFSRSNIISHYISTVIREIEYISNTNDYFSSSSSSLSTHKIPTCTISPIVSRRKTCFDRI